MSRLIHGKQERRHPDQAFNPACVPATVQGKFQVLLRFHGLCMQVTEDLGNPIEIIPGSSSVHSFRGSQDDGLYNHDPTIGVRSLRHTFTSPTLYILTS